MAPRTRASGAWRCKMDMALNGWWMVPCSRGSSGMVTNAESEGSHGILAEATRVNLRQMTCMGRAYISGATVDPTLASGDGTTWAQLALCVGPMADVTKASSKT